jgi:regulator of protease activity HflC (stomatin/prohibitin superfamily)
MSREFERRVTGGWVMLPILLAAMVAVMIAFVRFCIVAADAGAEMSDWAKAVRIILCALVLVILIILLCGFFTLQPNTAAVLLLFGAYKGTARRAGFHWANPFYGKHKISLRIRNFNTDKVKVNDQRGNPIEIGAVVVWRVEETAQACFDVDDYQHYVNVSHLAYAPEIAGAMLRRQQAEAIVAARTRIVEGAVGMVEMALEHLERHKTVELDEERKAAMISNLLVVLCGEQAAHPVVNTGTLYT